MKREGHEGTRRKSGPPTLVERIYVCPDKGLPMQEVSAVEAIAGQGLAGDRYALNRGTYSGKRHNRRHVTLISAAKIAEANAHAPNAFTAAETRRNIVLSGSIDLLSLIGREFSLGESRMLGVEECVPCKIPSQLTGKPNFFEAFTSRGGLRAEILCGGRIAVGDSLERDEQ